MNARTPYRISDLEDREIYEAVENLYVLDRAQRQLRDRLERLEDSLADDGAGLVALVLAVRVQAVLELLEGQDVGEVALVVLEDERKVFQVNPDLRQVRAQIDHALDVGVVHGPLGVADEDDAIHAFQDELAGGVVEDLARNGIELDAGLEASDDPDVERKQVEEERPVRLRLERDHLAPRARGGAAVDMVEVRRLSTQTGAVIDDLGRHLHGGIVEKNHGF